MGIEKHIARKVISTDISRKMEERTIGKKIEECESTRHENYRTESGRGDIAKEDSQPHKPPQMTGEARANEEGTYFHKIHETDWN